MKTRVSFDENVSILKRYYSAVTGTEVNVTANGTITLGSTNRELEIEDSKKGTAVQLARIEARARIQALIDSDKVYGLLNAKDANVVDNSSFKPMPDTRDPTVRASDRLMEDAAWLRRNGLEAGIVFPNLTYQDEYRSDNPKYKGWNLLDQLLGNQERKYIYSYQTPEGAFAHETLGHASDHGAKRVNKNTSEDRAEELAMAGENIYHVIEQKPNRNYYHVRESL